MDIWGKKRGIFIRVMPETSPKTGLGKNTMSLQNLFLPTADFSLSSTSPHFLTSPPKNQPKKLSPAASPQSLYSRTSRRKGKRKERKKKRILDNCCPLPFFLLSNPSQSLVNTGFRGFLFRENRERKRRRKASYRQQYPPLLLSFLIFGEGRE